MALIGSGFLLAALNKPTANAIRIGSGGEFYFPGFTAHMCIALDGQHVQTMHISDNLASFVIDHNPCFLLDIAPVHALGVVKAADFLGGFVLFLAGHQGQ